MTGSIARAVRLTSVLLALMTVAACGRKGEPAPPGPSPLIIYPRGYPPPTGP